MKIQILVLSLALGIFANVSQAQVIVGDAGKTNNANLSLPAAEPLMKEIYVPGENGHNKAIQTCTDKNNYPEGRLSGTNTYRFFLRGDGNLTAMQYYPDFDGKVTGIFFDGFSSTFPSNSVNLVVYTVDAFGDPAIRIANTSVLVGTGYQEYGSMLAAPISVSGGFYAGVEYNVQTKDTIFIYTNSDGNGNFDNNAYFQDNFGDIGSVYFDIGLNIDFLIRPVVEFNAEASFTPDPTSVCEGENITFLNNSNLPPFFTSTYFNQVSGSVYEWDFGDGSPKNTQGNPTHQYNNGAGKFNVTLSALFNGWNSNCIITEDDSVSIESEPESFFTYKSDKLNVTFFNETKYGKTYDWDLGNAGATSSVDNPIYSYPAPGKYPITLIATGDCGQDAYANFIEVSDTMDFNTTAIEEVGKMLGVSIYPNPTSGMLYLSFDQLSHARNVQIEVFNTVGEKIHSKKIFASPNNKYELNLENYHSGMYVIRIQSDREQVAKTFIKY